MVLPTTDEVRDLSASACIQYLLATNLFLSPYVRSELLGLIEKHHLSVSPPESRVHRYGGPNAGWGQSGVWSCTSFTLRDGNKERGVAHGATAEEALLRYLLIMHIRGAVI